MRKQKSLTFLFCVLSFFVFVQSAQAIQVQGAQIQGARDNAQVYSGVVYGPIDQNDTLWRIASRYKQDSQFSVYQTMMAIYQLNPQSFENGNFNTMVNGATLRLPSDRYIARIDIREARAKAERDDQAFGRPNSVRENVNTTSPNANPANNMKPDVPLVNKEDLSNTQAQLQNQLNSLRRQQQQQFQQLKDQVAASINSVEVLLEENKKLNEQLVLIDENNRNLTQTVETELQSQIDQQVEQLSELIALVKQAEQRRVEQESQSIMQILSSPMAIIIMMSSVTLLIIIALALILMRKTTPHQGASKKSKVDKSSDIVDDDLVIGEVDDEIDQDSDDLLAALSEAPDLEEDDILSDALEEDEALANLDDEILGDELDDMLVPDSKSTSDSLTDSLDMVDLDLDAEDDISLDDEEGISLDSDDISLDDDEISLDSDIENEEQIGAVPSEDEASSQAEPKEAVKPAPSSINEVDEDDGLPEGIDLNANGEIDENTLDQIEKQIEEKDETINRMADEILNELDSVPSDSSDVDEVIANENVDLSSIDDTDLSSLVDDEELPSIENTDTPDVSTDELETVDQASDLSDELLDELSSSNEAAQALDALIDEDISQDDIDDDIDAILAQTNAEEKADALSEDVLDLSDDIALDEQEALQNDQVDALANELLQELESENADSDQLDDILAEFEDDDSITEQVEQSTQNTNEEPPALDPDDLLDDIPSFTHDLSGEGAQSDEDSIPSEVMQNDVLASELDDQNAEEKAQVAEHEVDEAEEDVLASLPDLDNWLDEDVNDQDSEKLASDIAQMSEKEDELDLSALDIDLDDIDVLGESDETTDESQLMKELDDSSFDDMLLDLTDDEPESKQESVSPASDSSKAPKSESDLLSEAGLDIDTLLQEVSEEPGDNQDAFVDVDELLKESNAMPEMSDDEKALDLSASLGNTDNASGPQHSPEQAEQQLASNLDLAQVYIDMDDKEAAKELLEEVIAQGNDEQKREAMLLLNSL